MSNTAQSTGSEAVEARRALAQHLAAHYARLPEVIAVALAGSHTAASADAGSDIDLYVFGDAPPADALVDALDVLLKREELLVARHHLSLS
jgi:predicted nucleotidyltransferase